VGRFSGRVRIVGIAEKGNALVSRAWSLPDQVEDVIVATLESVPGKDTHWSRVSSAAVCCGMLAGRSGGGQD
jgi:hypothetical protein